MILESLIQFLSTALAFTLLITLFSAFVFYGRYKAKNSVRPNVSVPESTVVSAATSVEVAGALETAAVRASAGRKRLHFASAKEA
jgi:predicted transcriptional regulator